MASLTLSVETLQHAGRTVKVVKFTGMADATNVTALDTEVQTQLGITPETPAAAQGLDLLIDGSELTYINSTFIGHLTDWYSRLIEVGGRLMLIRLAPQPLDALSVVGILGVIPHHLSLDEAKLELSKPA